MSTDLEAKADAFIERLRKADHVLIGAGAGLSASAGVNYTDEVDFAHTFPVLARRGFKARYQMIGFDGFTRAQHWAYWATHVENVRFHVRTHRVYTSLRDLTASKDTFVLTSNVDAMFARHGFDERRIFTPQGDYASMQCRTPCRRAVWPSRPDVERMLGCIDAKTFEVTESAAIPRCPSCGGEVFFNVRLDSGFVDEPYREQADRMRDWLGHAARGKLLLLDIGAGFNTPSVVRWQMERLALAVPHADFVRINRDDASAGRVPVERALSIEADADAILDAIARSRS